MNVDINPCNLATLAYNATFVPINVPLHYITSVNTDGTPYHHPVADLNTTLDPKKIYFNSDD